MSYLPYAVAAWVFLVGLYGIVTGRNLIYTVICVSVLQSSTYVLLLAIGYRTNGAAPVFADIPLSAPTVDPVLQALMLTDIVVEVTVMALLLAIAIQVNERFGTIDPEELNRLRG